MTFTIGEPNHLWGYIPTFLDLDDPRSAVEQFDAHYISGWRKFEGFVLDKKKLTIKYPGDPAYKPLDKRKFRDDLIVLYPHGWVMVLKADGKYEICRMD